MKNQIQETPLQFNIVYEDENGKKWKFSRLKKTRVFIREDGKRFSHSHIYTNYSYVSRTVIKANA